MEGTLVPLSCCLGDSRLSDDAVRERDGPMLWYAVHPGQAQHLLLVPDDRRLSSARDIILHAVAL